MGNKKISQSLKEIEIMQTAKQLEIIVEVLKVDKVFFNPKGKFISWSGLVLIDGFILNDNFNYKDLFVSNPLIHKKTFEYIVRWDEYINIEDYI